MPKRDVSHALRHSTDPMAAIALADMMEERGEPEIECLRWRLYGEWLQTINDVIARGSPTTVYRAPAYMRERCFVLPRAVWTTPHQGWSGSVTWTAKTIECQFLASGPSRMGTVVLWRPGFIMLKRCFAGSKGSKMLRDKVRQMVDAYILALSAALVRAGAKVTFQVA